GLPLAAGLEALAAGRARLRAARERELRPRRGMLPPDQDVVARVLALVPETRLEARVEVVERQRFGVVGEAHAALEEPYGVLPVLPPSAEGLVEAARLEQESPRERRVSAREVHVRPDVTGLPLATEVVLPPRAQHLCPPAVARRHGRVGAEGEVVVGRVRVRLGV